MYEILGLILMSSISVILLKAGGIMAYCGPTTGAQSYFEQFGYELPMGENTAGKCVILSVLVSMNIFSLQCCIRFCD